MAQMENLRPIMTGRVFEIPQNQRGFSWTDQNLNDLVADLELHSCYSSFGRLNLHCSMLNNSFHQDGILMEFACFLAKIEMTAGIGQSSCSAFTFATIVVAVAATIEVDEGVPSYIAQKSANKDLEHAEGITTIECSLDSQLVGQSMHLECGQSNLKAGVRSQDGVLQG